MIRVSLAAVLFVSAASSVHAQSEEFGAWQSLFNGSNLSGWVSTSAPAAPNGWTVEDGVLTMPSGKGKDICTARAFGDYELELEYRIPVRGNSGVYLRGVVEVQVEDNGTAPPTSTSSGSLYAKHTPLKNAQKPAGEWNHYRILHIGSRITVWHNGELVQDNVHFDGMTGGPMRTSPVSGRTLAGKVGPVRLQGDHGPVGYRNLRIRELFGDDWLSLWNGNDLSSFTARGDKRAKNGLLWKIEDHAFTNTGSGSHGHDIWTQSKYGNFLVHYAYKSDPSVEGGNSGFYLRDQWEIQIYKDSRLDNKHSDGCLYSLRTPDVVARHGPEQWNHMDVKVDGMKIWVWQNGKLTHDSVTLKTRTDNHGVPTPKFSKESFKIQGDHGKVFFSDLRIKELPE